MQIINKFEVLRLFTISHSPIMKWPVFAESVNICDGGLRFLLNAVRILLI